MCFGTHTNTVNVYVCKSLKCNQYLVKTVKVQKNPNLDVALKMWTHTVTHMRLLNLLQGVPPYVHQLTYTDISKSTNPRIHKLVAKDGNIVNITILLENKSIDVEILKRIVKRINELKKDALAYEAYDMLYKIWNLSEIRALTAKHRNATEEFLAELITLPDCDKTLLLAVADSKKTSASTLDAMIKAADSDSGAMISCVLRNPNVSVETVEYLVSEENVLNSQNQGCYYAVLDYGNVNEKILRKIMYAAAANDNITLTKMVFSVAVKKSFKLSEELYPTLNSAGVLTSTDYVACLTAKFEFTQTELIELIELYGPTVEPLIAKNYVINSPMLANMLNISAKRVIKNKSKNRSANIGHTV